MDNATLTNVLLAAFGVLITVLLGVIGFMIQRYIKTTDEKFDLLFRVTAKQTTTTNNLRFLLAWLVTVLDTRGCVDSGDQPALVEDEDESTDPVKEMHRVLAARRKAAAVTQPIPYCKPSFRKVPA